MHERIVCEANRHDFATLPTNIRAGMTVHLAMRYPDVAAVVFGMVAAT